MVCKKCLEDKTVFEFYKGRKICKKCILDKNKSGYISVKKVNSTIIQRDKKITILSGEYRTCNYCAELLDTSCFYGDKKRCKICDKEAKLFQNSSIDKFFEPGALDEIHMWVLNVVVPELNHILNKKAL